MYIYIFHIQGRQSGAYRWCRSCRWCEHFVEVVHIDNLVLLMALRIQRNWEYGSLRQALFGLSGRYESREMGDAEPGRVGGLYIICYISHTYYILYNIYPILFINVQYSRNRAAKTARIRDAQASFTPWLFRRAWLCGRKTPCRAWQLMTTSRQQPRQALTPPPRLPHESARSYNNEFVSP